MFLFVSFIYIYDRGLATLLVLELEYSQQQTTFLFFSLFIAFLLFQTRTDRKVTRIRSAGRKKLQNAPQTALLTMTRKKIGILKDGEKDVF